MVKYLINIVSVLCGIIIKFTEMYLMFSFYGSVKRRRDIAGCGEWRRTNEKYRTLFILRIPLK